MRPKRQSLQVSDHALVRFLERGLGIDIEEIKSQMLGKSARAMTRLGDGRYPISKGCKAIVTNRIVVTVIK